MYPYDLGYHLLAKKLCRIPKGIIPPHCVKIVWYKEPKQYYRHDPYDDNGQLIPIYWSIIRWLDCENELGLPHTILVMYGIPYKFVNGERIFSE